MYESTYQNVNEIFRTYAVIKECIQFVIAYRYILEVLRLNIFEGVCSRIHSSNRKYIIGFEQIRQKDRNIIYPAVHIAVNLIIKQDVLLKAPIGMVVVFYHSDINNSKSTSVKTEPIEKYVSEKYSKQGNLYKIKRSNVINIYSSFINIKSVKLS